MNQTDRQVNNGTLALSVKRVIILLFVEAAMPGKHQQTRGGAVFSQQIVRWSVPPVRANFLE